MPHLLFGLVEVVMLVLFALSARFAYRAGGRQRLIELLSAVPFGLLLEQGDIKIFGSYAYNQDFFIKLGSVPVAIALAWAMIITSSMYMSDRLRIPPRVAPFADAVFAILLDLSLDAIAIRQGLWHWNIPLNAGFFGVPAGNYYGWLFVAFGFSAWTRWLRGRIADGSVSGWLQLFVPIPAYLTLLVALVPFIVLQQLFFGGPTGGFPPFLFALALFVLLTGRSIGAGHGDLPPHLAMPLFPRLLMHGYFITAGIALGIFQRFPVLLAMSLSMVVIELSLGPTARHRLVPLRRSVPRPLRRRRSTG